MTLAPNLICLLVSWTLPAQTSAVQGNEGQEQPIHSDQTTVAVEGDVFVDGKYWDRPLDIRLLQGTSSRYSFTTGSFSIASVRIEPEVRLHVRPEGLEGKTFLFSGPDLKNRLKVELKSVPAPSPPKQGMKYLHGFVFVDGKPAQFPFTISIKDSKYPNSAIPHEYNVDEKASGMFYFWMPDLSSHALWNITLPSAHTLTGPVDPKDDLYLQIDLQRADLGLKPSASPTNPPAASSDANKGSGSHAKIATTISLPAGNFVARLGGQVNKWAQLETVGSVVAPLADKQLTVSYSTHENGPTTTVGDYVTDRDGKIYYQFDVPNQRGIKIFVHVEFAGDDRYESSKAKKRLGLTG